MGQHATAFLGNWIEKAYKGLENKEGPASETKK